MHLLVLAEPDLVVVEAGVAGLAPLLHHVSQLLVDGGRVVVGVHVDVGLDEATEEQATGREDALVEGPCVGRNILLVCCKVLKRDVIEDKVLVLPSQHFA